MSLVAEEGLEPPTKTFKGFCTTLCYSALIVGWADGSWTHFSRIKSALHNRSATAHSRWYSEGELNPQPTD